MADAHHILVVDDSLEIRNAVSRYLIKNGMRVTKAENASEMDAALAKSRFDLIVLDVMMPGEDGLSICRRLSSSGTIPILMLTALGEEMDRIVGLEVGADDYLAKPFNPRELLARIKAILRRAGRPEMFAGSLAGRRISFGHQTLNTDTRVLVDEDGAEAQLSVSEFKLLTVLLERPRLVLTRDELLDLTAGRTAGLFDRTIDNQVSRLRRRVEKDPMRPKLITTVRGGGYCLSADVEDAT
ncbi:response regulator [Roseovarius sp. S1116L3]|uniref:Two-component system, OmpR family, response regulator n=1 Tax=Roseovarius nanhaiticus TaxID=573024 RepID=A0A1N7EWU9_9RHOB|nr:response regulator [Roseovarius nanhaiticus]SEK65381.1 two-component system, OmpR family, response regulator [Roseovarius nanhaiticus]SIR92425.1 two-component system, OmpR family, response regulator [Roseovarius nanhaiticus]